jgi:hypothetical protein
MSLLEMERKQQEFKMVALRFLKETGLLPYWSIYVKERPYMSPTSWYRRKYIDSIFGMTDFTSWLGKNFNIILPYRTNVTNLFRYFVSQEYSKKCFRFEFSLIICESIKELIKNKNTYNIKTLLEA